MGRHRLRDEFLRYCRLRANVGMELLARTTIGLDENLIVVIVQLDGDKRRLRWVQRRDGVGSATFLIGQRNGRKFGESKRWADRLLRGTIVQMRFRVGVLQTVNASSTARTLGHYWFGRIHHFLFQIIQYNQLIIFNNWIQYLIK